MPLWHTLSGECAFQEATEFESSDSFSVLRYVPGWIPVPAGIWCSVADRKTKDSGHWRGRSISPCRRTNTRALHLQEDARIPSACIMRYDGHVSVQVFRSKVCLSDCYHCFLLQLNHVRRAQYDLRLFVSNAARWDSSNLRVRFLVVSINIVLMILILIRSRHRIHGKVCSWSPKPVMRVTLLHTVNDVSSTEL